MQQNTFDEKIKVRMFNGLGRTLIISFLMLALIPVTVISIIGYNKAHQGLEQEIHKGLETAAVLKTREISAYFDTMLAQLRFQSETRANALLLEELINAHEASGKSAGDFVKSYKWAIIDDELGRDIKSFRKSYNYHDIFLLDQAGDILFTVAGEDDLGANLLTGDYSSSKFAKACRKTLETGKISFSDYEHYAPSGDKVYGFLTVPVVGRYGDRIGVMAFQFQIDPITRIMKKGITLGKTAETYLVGPDLTLRSGLTLDRERALIDEKILTEQTVLFKNRIHEKTAAEEMVEEVIDYQGPHGEEVLGIHNGIMIVDTMFAVISEVDKSEAFAVVSWLRRTMVLLAVLTGFVVIVFAFILVRRIVRPVTSLSKATKKAADGDFNQQLDINVKNEIGELADSFNTMMEYLEKNRVEKINQDWFTTGQMEMNSAITGISDIPELSRSIVTTLAKYVNADIGAIYIANDDNRFCLTGSYAFTFRKHLVNEFDMGQGLVGQAALEKQRIILTRVPADYILIQSGLGEIPPTCIVVMPLIYNDNVLGVIELGAIETFSENALKFFDFVCGEIAVAIQTVTAHSKVEELLEKTQVQAMELGVQQEELKQSNKSLEKQAANLKKSKADLMNQKEELRQTNESLSSQSVELEKQTTQLEEQKSEIENQKTELEISNRALEKKAAELEVSGNYKSEFLANMSHELRTPLNSILLLSKHLADNQTKNLTEKQVKSAGTVHKSGNELLSLINDVLDLSKVEAGHIGIDPGETALSEIIEIMERNFRPVAEGKGIDFNTSVSKELPEFIKTDTQLVSQILKNLLSNALKFTDKGEVTFEVCRPGPDNVKNDKIVKTEKLEKTIAFIVRDLQEYKAPVCRFDIQVIFSNFNDNGYYYCL